MEEPMDKAYNAADVHPIYMKAFNAGDVEAAVACYEPDGCFVSASGRIARGATELREVYRITFANRPTFQVDVRKVLPAGNDLALSSESGHRGRRHRTARPRFGQGPTRISSESSRMVLGGSSLIIRMVLNRRSSNRPS
jgi:ketosteroid isomerase-like protein